MKSRENLLNKVRAILSKTVDNGCTEAEALLALQTADYFRLQLRNLQAIERDSKAELVRGFQIIEPRRLWA